MAVTIIMFLCVGIAAGGFVPISLGIGFLILYIRNRGADNKQKKLGLILPSVSLCIGEMMSTPLLAMLSIPILGGLDTDIVIMVLLGLLLGMFICGVILCTICAVKAYRGNPVGNKFFVLSLTLFFIGFYICAFGALFIILFLLMNYN